jgi:hypothetical protein
MIEQRYGALRLIASVLRVLAWVVAIGCGLGFLVALIVAATGSHAEAVMIGPVLLLYGIFGFIYVYACAEGIHVVLDIEANTRATSESLARLAQAPPGPPVGP